MLRKIAGFLKNPGVRQRGPILFTYLRLSTLARWRQGPGSVRMLGFTVHYPDYRTLLFLYEEIFLGQHYAAALPEKPTIIDAGANIGLSTLFFKLHYPDAQIACFEPHPETFALLKKNIEVNSLNEVTLHQEALSAEAGTVDLFGDGIGASVDDQLENNKSRAVEAQCLSVYLDSSVDLLKIDIEGAEGPVLQEVGPKLRMVKRLIIEFHGFPNTWPLSSILALFEKQNYSYFINRWSRLESDIRVHYCLISAERLEV